MSRAAGRMGASALLALTLAVSLAAQPRSGMVGLLVTPFAGPDPLGRKAATVLQLQVWQTLRLAPPNNKQKLTFGRGIVYWDEGTAPARHAEAIARLAGLEAQMVLWGRAQEFGTGVVVQAYLSVVDPRGTAGSDGSFWTIALPELGAKQGISVGLPASMYEFRPIVLRSEVIPLLNTPAGLPIYEDRAFVRKIGELGGDFKALEQGSDVARVQSGGVNGWVRLPGLSANRTEVTDFSGALIRIYRKDWGGAIDLFGRVTGNREAPASIRVSSYLLMAAASRLFHEQTGAPDRSLELIQAAERLNPYLRETIKYKCMALLAARNRPENVRKLEETVKTSGYLFPRDDGWLAKVKSIVGRSGGSR